MAAIEWTKGRGSVSEWPRTIDFNMLTAESPQAVANDWQAHAKLGKTMMDDVEYILECRLPSDGQALRKLFREAFDLLSTLQAGISTIETYFETAGKEFT